MPSRAHSHVIAQRKRTFKGLKSGAKVKKCNPMIREAENNRKRYFSELRKVVNAADVVIEVLDARDPAGCRSVALEAEVTAAGKRLVLLLNKIDLVPPHARDAWLLYLRRSFPTLAFKACHGAARRPVHANTSLAAASQGLLRSGHAVVGADELMQLLKNYARLGGGQAQGEGEGAEEERKPKRAKKAKAHLHVGIVGYPNTGKSSVINSMKRDARKVEVGAKPGVTKAQQEIVLDSKITLIDCPGVIFEGDSEDPTTWLRNIVRVEHVDDPLGIVEALMAKAPPEAVKRHYGLPSECTLSGPSELLIHVAQVRGKLRRGGGLDISAAARSVIADWTSGRFRYFTLPPSQSAEEIAVVEDETAKVLTAGLAPALDIESLFKADGSAPRVLAVPFEDKACVGGFGGPVHVQMDESEEDGSIADE